jgi:GT2 family glycosyltransferase
LRWNTYVIMPPPVENAVGMRSPATVTVIVAPRERFSYSERSLESIYANTRPPFSLVYVDGGSPRKTRDYLAHAAKDKGFKLIRREYYLSPNQARNIGANGVDTDYLVFIDNDVIVEPGWLDKLVTCADETGAWIVSPIYCIGDPAEQVVHMAGGDARIVEEGGKRVFREQHRLSGKRLSELDPSFRRSETELAEFHCMLVRRDVLRRLGPFDEGLLCSREHIDFCLLAREAGGRVFVEPESVISYVPPPPFALSDIPFYLLRWSDEWGFATMRHFHRKWHLDDPDDALIGSWIRKHRRVLFERTRKASMRVFGWRLGNLACDGVATAVEAMVKPFAIRRGPQPHAVGGNPAKLDA